ncbi:hypothetical protein CCL11_07375 [Pseudomonas syringae]|nr:hypothetical protein AL061_12735 [Pseudomonas syringae pv. syringae]KWS27437.1 hypothetical protein AL062_08990 [Pseudomonas syringae pv. syringae]MCA5967573.1 hypothetical protein [Pseudomonas sp. P129]PBP48545.1 hypothetical protein CCL11_07375 [Pseudomonas syringae]
MAKKIKLVDFKGDAIYRGNILRVCGKYPYEEFVDFMFFEAKLTGSTYGLMVVSGYKAGLILVYLPNECLAEDGGIDKAWLVKNWSNWIYPDCDVSDVYWIEMYNADAIVKA